MIKTLKPFLLTILISFFISILVTFIYIKLPPFYIYSFNYAVVPTVENTPANFNYNNFYQSELSNNITSSLSLFAANADFKETVSKQTGINILYFMSKTNGTNLVNLKLVSLKKVDFDKTNTAIEKNLGKSLTYFVNDKISYSLKSMPEFNHLYVGGLSVTKLFTIVFSTILVLISTFLLLKKYYDEK